MSKKMCITTTILLSFFLSINPCPQTIFITRHAEKTFHKKNVTFESWHLKNTKPLSTRGWERAYALAPFFSMDSRVTKYGPITALFAPQANDCYNSIRPIETLTPFAQKAQLKINTEFSLCIEDIKKMVKTILNSTEYNNTTIWIAYEHEHIPLLTSLFLEETKNKKINYPKEWDHKSFDRVWILEFDTKSHEVTKFKNIPQRLLIHDSKK